MRSRFARPATAVLVATLTLASYALYILHEDGRSYVRYQLQQSGVPLNSGALSSLKLTWYREVLRRDPSFSIAGTDTQAFKNALDDIRKQQDQIKEFYAGNDTRVVSDAFSTQEFLRSLIPLTEARGMFLREPSYVHALKYFNSYISTASSYDKSVERLIDAYGTLPQETRFAFQDGVATPASFTMALEQLRVENNVRADTETRRLRCLLFFSTSCDDVRYLTFTHIDALDMPTIEKPSQFTIALNNRAILDDVLDSIPGIQDRPENPTIISDSLCERDSPAITRIMERSDSEGHLARRPVFLNDIGIIDLTRIPGAFASTDRDAARSRGASPGLNDTYREKGARHLYQSSANSYLCTNADADIASVARVLGVREIMRTLIVEGSSTPAMRLRTDAQVLQESFVSTHDAARAVRDVALVLASPLRTTIFTEGTETAAEAMIAEYESGMLRFDEVIRGQILEDTYLTTMHEYGDTMPVTSLLLSRIHPTLYLLAFNMTVTQRPVSLLETAHKNDLGALRLTTFDQLVTEGLSPERLKKDLRNAQDIAESILKLTQDATSSGAQHL